MNVWLKRLGWICLTPICLVLLLSILLYIPPIQDFAIREAAKFAANSTGMQFNIKKIRLSFPLDLTVKDVEILKTPTDTILDLESLTLRIQALPLLKKQVLIEGIDIRKALFNTDDLIDGVQVKGVLGNAYTHADKINLSDETARLNILRLANSTITVLINDTTSTPPDTTSAPIRWILNIEKIHLDQVALALQMPQDSLRLISYVTHAQLNNGTFDLGKEMYQADNLRFMHSLLGYDGDYNKPAEGLDFAHIYLSKLNASFDSIFYEGQRMRALIKDFAAQERSGLEVVALNGQLVSDEEKILLPKLLLQTPHSTAELEAEIPWSALDAESRSDLTASLKAEIGKKDLMIAAGSLPADLKRDFPDKSLRVHSEIMGNMSSLRMTRCDILLPDAFEAHLSGGMEAVLDEKHRTGGVELEATAGDLNFLLAVLPEYQRSFYNIPESMSLKGEASMNREGYHTEMSLREGHGAIHLSAEYKPKQESYFANIQIDSLEPIHFMPHDSLFWLAAEIHANGQGTDIFSSKTGAKLNGKIKDIRYGASSVSNISIKGLLADNKLNVNLKSLYPLAKMDLDLSASIRKNDVKAMFVADIDHMDLYGLHFINLPLSTSFQLFAEAESDLNEVNKLDVTLGNWDLATAKERFRPKTLTLHAHTDEDTTHVSFHAGDLGIVLTGNDCVHHISSKLMDVSNSITQQLKEDSTANLQVLRPLLPEMDLKVRAGQDNPIYNFLQAYYTDFKSLRFNAYISPESGVKMDAAIYDLARDTMLIDTIRAEIHQDSLGLLYNAEIIKKKYRKQAPFSAGIYGKLRQYTGNTSVYFKDGKGKTGVLLEVQAEKTPNGVQLRLLPEEPIIAFRPFKLNKDNFITVRSFYDMDADIRFTGPNNAYIWLHSQDEGDRYKEIHLELSQIDLDVITKAFTYLPPMRGIVNTAVKYAPTDSTFMVVADVNVDKFFYENERVGDLMFNAVYLPLEQENHQVDLHFFRDLEEISSASVFYQSGEKDSISGSLDFIQFPLNIADAFIPEDMAKMKGRLNGSLDLSGSSDRPMAEGSLKMDSGAVYVGALGSTFRFDNKDIKVKNNRILFDKYGIYAFNKNPFIIDGAIDFSNIDRMTANLTMKAQNLQLLNVKKTEQSLAYGKLFVNLNSTVKGLLSELVMRGDLQLLGNTNVSYVLKDSPLAVQDRMSGLVNFTSFADTVRRRMPKKPPLPVGGLDMLMTIRIDPAVQMNVDLGTDDSNKIKLEGGGDLSFQYTPQGDMFLNGRYTLSGGTIRYSIPVIPLKEFNIKEGSFVQWTGNPMDPTLNLKATERIRSSVTPMGQSSPRLVNFDVGIELTQKLENLGLQFTLEAPEDLAMQEELASKGIEEQSKLAVSMLVTGMYLGGSSNGKVNMNMGNALNSFLQSEINNIAGDALKTVDISFGMDTYDDAGKAGSSRTDYSFRFAKRFYNNRIRIILGGRISTGENINSSQTQTFIDNVSIEYRLDNSGSRYVKLFHNKNYESLLEGEIMETGAGIVLRKKMMKLRELFNFKKPKVKPVQEEDEEK